MPHRHHDGVEDYEDGSATTCSICDDEVAVPPDINAFAQWLFDGPSISAAQQLAAWTSLQDEMKHEGMKASKEFEEAFNLFQSLRCWQHKLLVQWRSFQVIETVCAKELKKREQGGKHVPQSYKLILAKMLEPFVNAEEDSMSPTRRYELDAILEVLTEADGSNEDAFIRMAIQKKTEQLSLELCRIAEPITRNAGVMWRILAIYKQASLDYRGIMLALVQIFIHAKLEALVNEEEKQKSDAVTEALLSELALDTKKNTGKGNNDQKLSKKTSKAKKKIKDHIKVKDPKATCGDELTEAQEEKTEQGHFAVVGASADELKLQEEELRRNILLEDRKLKEMLEYQRQVEDEAKQMALAKETTNEAAPVKVEESDKPVVCSQRTKRRRKKDSSKARKNLPLKTIPESEEDVGVLSTFGTFGTISGADIFNPGLRNDAGEYNCFLNVIVQTLWHLRRFREVFMSISSSEHVHIGDPCVVCALEEIFIALSVASANKQREAISPTSLRNAVIKLDPDRNLFQENIHPESHFDELFKLAESNYVECEPQFACDPEKGGCGKPKSLLSYLRTPPHVFSIALLWPTDSESREDILATLTALTTEIDLAVFHDGVVLGNKHSLFSMVCYFGKHHICFAYSHELEKWIMYDDETVEEVGCWDDVISTCERGCLQPQFLFFEAVK
ncbi:hypothetical protein Vadar_018514 [Vaccinium darrowii]|uniref:Uncharacterized protein n=1 Tax=Vaccinium darrowii TaxID=229202 RepID=A0ACB7XZZ9_9ERIC|nr:hypothetical protein Vadar_018514 [Vaccinium darrowii]